LFIFVFHFFVITIMADEPVVVMAEPLESASDRDAANFRDASMRQLEMYVDKAKRLAEERISLGNGTSDKRRKAAIDEELPDIRANVEALRLCIDGTEYLRARREGVRGGARTIEAAAATSVPRQPQPVKAKSFKMPDPKLFPPWSVGGRGEPLDLRRWFLSAERVCQTHRLKMCDWGRAVALILPSGHHQDWIYRWMDEHTDAGWDKLVEAFVTAFQQQTSMDILEAEWESLQQGTQTVNAYYAKFVELCHAVQLDIKSTFVVRKFLRKLTRV
jgi:hypothetical protein